MRERHDRDRAPHARIATASIQDVELPRCVAIVAVGEIVSYAFAAPAWRDDARAFFRRAYTALTPGGVFVFVFDFVARGREPTAHPRRTFVDGDGWTVLLEASEDPERSLVTRRITTFRAQGSTYRRSNETHVVRAFSPGDLRQLITEAGFRVIDPLPSLWAKPGYDSLVAISAAG